MWLACASASCAGRKRESSAGRSGTYLGLGAMFPRLLRTGPTAIVIAVVAPSVPEYV